MASPIDIKAVLARLFVDGVLIPRQQVEKQGGITAPLEYLRTDRFRRRKRPLPLPWANSG
jgi:hypothetical protein